MNVGDKGTIKRGKYRGQRGEVRLVQGAVIAVSVQDDAGQPVELITLDASSFTPDPEPTIEVRAVREALENVALESWGNVDNALHSLAKQLGIETVSE